MLGTQQMVVPLLNKSIIRDARKHIISLFESHLLSGPAPWQKSTKVDRWSKENYRKQEKHEALIIPKLNKQCK